MCTYAAAAGTSLKHENTVVHVDPSAVVIGGVASSVSNSPETTPTTPGPLSSECKLRFFFYGLPSFFFCLHAIKLRTF